MRLKQKSENWRRKLTRPIVLRDGKAMHILADCRDYCIGLDEHEAARAPWQHTIKLMFAAAAGGDIETVVTQFETILLHQNKIKLPE